MLSYTFSRREKALLVVLALIALTILWYLMVYRGATGQLAGLELQLAQVESSIELDTARVAQMEKMRSEVEQRKEQGAKPSNVPDYDNLQPLTVELSGILGAVDSYALSFDDVSADADAAGYVRRGVRIDFGCGSYAAAKAVVDALAEGTYPCVVDSAAITDNRARNGRITSGSSRSSSVTASVHATFVERAA